MGAIFTSPRNTVIAGVVLLVIIVVVIGLLTGQMTHIDHAWSTFAMRWLIPLLADFRKVHPEIDVRITAGGVAAPFGDD